jgi:hypothetical protein
VAVCEGGQDSGAAVNAPPPEWFPEHPDYGRHLARQILQRAVADARHTLNSLDLPNAERDIGGVLWELAVQGIPTPDWQL